MEDRIKELVILLVALFLSRIYIKDWPSMPSSLTDTLSSLITSSSTVVTTVTAPVLLVSPHAIEQGDPIMVVVQATSSLKQMTFAGELVSTVTYAGKPTGFIGIDLNKKAGTYILKATLTNGVVLEKKIAVTARQKVSAPLGIPDKLGGNTPAAATAVVSSLENENTTLAALPTAKVAYWTEAFHYPVANPVVTDIYGYSRQTGQYSIPHKGADFAAATGTPVMAINTGVITFAGDLGIYGTTVVIDHGLGVESFYMHLSSVAVKKGQMVQRGRIIGASGDTGYAEGPHLHLTIRVDGVSIDPIIFLKFFR